MHQHVKSQSIECEDLAPGSCFHMFKHMFKRMSGLVNSIVMGSYSDAMACALTPTIDSEFTPVDAARYRHSIQHNHTTT